MHWLIHLQILLLFAVPFVPAFIVGCFEKRAIRMFETGEMKVQTKYLQLMTAAALAHGFTLRCTGHHVKYKNTLFAALYLSADRTILALIADGSIGAFRQPKTLLMSRFKDGSIVITINDAGMIELDEMTHRYILINAGFDELLAKHLALKNERIGPSLFPATADWTAVDNLYKEKTDRIVARGLARYTDAGHDFARYTPWGSFRATILFGIALTHRPATWLRQFRRKPGAMARS
ncbi:MAG: hypothetical protein ABSH08_08900 [Tepidisphaeraceae bacterium]